MHSKQKFIIKGDSWTKTCNKQICLHLVWEKSSSWNRHNSHKLEQDNKKHAHKYTNYFRLYGISRAVTFFPNAFTSNSGLITLFWISTIYSSVISYCNFLWSYELLLHFENSTFWWLLLANCIFWLNLLKNAPEVQQKAAVEEKWKKMNDDDDDDFLWEKLKSKASSSDERRAAAAKLKKFYTFLLSTQLYQIKRRETSTISISKVGNWVFISKKKFFFHN